MSSIDRRTFVSLGASTLAALALSACGGNGQGQGSSASSSTSSTGNESQGGSATQEAGQIKDGVLVTPYDEGFSEGLHHATIEVEKYGTITLELNATNAPITVSNFAHLANQKFYDGLTFHRIIKGFMIQGGDPNGDGIGGSDVKIKGEFSGNGVVNAIQHKRGVISMARSSANDSGSSQFFIMHEDRSSLDGQYAAFGRVTKGMEVVDAIAEVPVEDSNGTVAKANQPVIKSIVMDD